MVFSSKMAIFKKVGRNEEGIDTTFLSVLAKKEMAQLNFKNSLNLLVVDPLFYYNNMTCRDHSKQRRCKLC